ncbi:MAG: ABC transporter permease [Alphaproteobacteria bacterium]|jgi:microcin C transport system permease protein
MNLQEFYQNFKQGKRAYISYKIFLFLFVFCLFAEFIANDKPLLVYYKGGLYFPILTKYEETTFGGDFLTETDYKNEYIRAKIKENGWQVFPLIPYSFNTINYNLPTPAPSAPSLNNLLGTDDQGRDVLARVIYGLRISILFGLILTIITSVIGVIVGAVQGFYGGKLDLFMQRFLEIWGSVPTLFLIIILTTFITPSFWLLMGIMVLFSWMNLVGVVRAECLKTRKLNFVLSAKALGVSNRKILFRHVLPNSLVATITFLPFILNGSITTLTALDFLGFGLPVSYPSLGELLSQGKSNLNAYWLGLTGFFVIALLLSIMIFIGEGVRDVLNPNKTRT